MKTLLHNLHLLCPANKIDLQNAYLIIDGDVIFDFGTGDIPSDTSGFAQVIDCKGHTLTPGLIDIQVHLRDPGQTHKEDLISGSLSAVRGGITSVVCQPNTVPTLDCQAMLDYLMYKAREVAYCNIYAYASVTRGLKGEELSPMTELSKHPIVVRFTDDGLPVANALIMRRALEISSSTGKIIAQHAEDLALSNKGCMHEGQMSAKLGLRGIPSTSESIIVQRDIELLRAFGGRYHVLHMSAKETVEAVRKAKAEGLAITCEASPHHLVLTDEAADGYNTNAKMNPPLRGEEDRAALQEALFDGTIDAIATDHAPHDYESKLLPIETCPFGIVGLETMLPIALEFYHAGKISLPQLIATMTNRAANVVGIDRGTITKGKTADLTLIDLNHQWKIDINAFASKSKNSPFHGREVKGCAVLTIVGGAVKYNIL